MPRTQGQCADCGRVMIAQREWNRNPRSRLHDRVKASAFGMCQACYRRAHRHELLPQVTIGSVFPINCDRCGHVGEASTRREAHKIRSAHLESHGVRPSSRSAPELSDADLARLRQMVGVGTGPGTTATRPPKPSTSGRPSVP